MSVRHHWTDAQMRACVTALGEERARRLLSGIAPSWDEARDLALTVLAGTEWMERMAVQEWKEDTPNPVARFLSRIAREIRPDAEGCNSYHRAGARADWRSVEDVPTSIRGSFMIKYPYFFELRTLLGDAFADPERARKRARRESPETLDGREKDPDNSISVNTIKTMTTDGVLTNGAFVNGSSVNSSSANGSSELSATSTDLHAGPSHLLATESASPTASEAEALLAITILDAPTPTDLPPTPPPETSGASTPPAPASSASEHAATAPTPPAPHTAPAVPSVVPQAAPQAAAPLMTAASPDRSPAPAILEAPSAPTLASTGGSALAPVNSEPRTPAEPSAVVPTINGLAADGTAPDGAAPNGASTNEVGSNGAVANGSAKEDSAVVDDDETMDPDMEPDTSSDSEADSDSDIEFISFVPARTTPASASGSTSVSATSNALASSSQPNPRKRPRADSDDEEEVEFVAAGTFLSTTDEVRKTRSVLTGTFVASGPPPEGWDSVNLLTIDSDDEEDDPDVDSPSGLRRSRRVAALRRSDRAPRVNYADDAICSDGEDRPFQLRGRRPELPTPSRVQPPRGHNPPPTATTATASTVTTSAALPELQGTAANPTWQDSTALLKHSGWLTDNRLGPKERRAAYEKARFMRFNMIKDLQVVTKRRLVLSVPSSQLGLPMPSDTRYLFPIGTVDDARLQWVDSKIPARAVPHLSLARGNIINGHGRVMHFIIAFSMLTSWNFPAIIRQPRFLTGWVLIVNTTNSQPEIEAVMVIAAKFGATVALMEPGATWSDISLPKHRRAFFMHKLCKGPPNATIKEHKDKNGRQVVIEISLLCLLNLIDRHFMATLLSTSTYEPQKGIIVPP